MKAAQRGGPVLLLFEHTLTVVFSYSTNTTLFLFCPRVKLAWRLVPLGQCSTTSNTLHKLQFVIEDASIVRFSLLDANDWFNFSRMAYHFKRMLYALNDLQLFF